MKILLICLLINFTNVLFGQRDDGSRKSQNSLSGQMPGSERINPKARFHFDGRKRPILLPRPHKIRPRIPEKFQPHLKKIAKVSEKTIEQRKVDIMKKLRTATKLEDVLKMFPPKGMTMKRVPTKEGSKDKRTKMVVTKTTGRVPGEHGARVETKEMTFPEPAVCQPRLQCHDLGYLTEGHHGQVWPTHVEYRSCSGCCPANYEAVASEHEEPTVTNVIVILYEKAESVIKPFTYREHKACDCVCKLKEEHCKQSRKILNVDTCSCVCDPRSRTVCPSHQQWSDNECGCICREEKTCEKNQVFNKDECDCKCIEETSCRQFERWNEHVCACLPDFGK